MSSIKASNLSRCSSKRWIVDRATLRQARADDIRYLPEPEYLDYLSIYFANAITKLGRKLQFKQRIIATAIVFFRRFYLKNSYCETDPFLVIAACCYVAAKAEESPAHIKTVVSEARSLFSQEAYNCKIFPTENSKLAEMEFYLVGDLECDLLVFHPYRTLMTLCRCSREDFFPVQGFQGVEKFRFDFEAGELGAGVNGPDGRRYWGTGEGQLELSEGALQTAWFIINDTYRSDICLLYEPHLIAVAAIYLTLMLHPQTCETIELQLEEACVGDLTPSHSRRSTRKTTARDPVGFLAGLNVSFSLIAAIAQEIISSYSRWDRYKEDVSFSAMSPLTPLEVPLGLPDVTPTMLSALLVRIREARLADLSHPPNGRPLVVNKFLERTAVVG
ncbi:cyclin-like protein [Fistulina hepatica ATCC 64428]|uniref:Cyclin-like protein n=1 Tax=Fistulina hepatica ATCC 64428 TaxID=1128425 RepID=A0A0D7A575_9AGAR|nr:cyclin-like protein [Fistulina hepatica ATCC 64428]